MILDDILDAKRREVAAAKARLPLEEIARRAAGRRPERAFRRALLDASKRPALIAELKRKSPSKGMLRERFDPVSLAQQLEGAGASALSVLTDERFFGGHLEFLRDAHQFTEIPTLRKDFIIDAYQVHEALIHQADAILLLVAALDQPRLVELYTLARAAGLDALVEVHSEAELERALALQPDLIGINQRDLRTFSLHPKVIAQLAPQIPKGATIIAESGMQTADDVAEAVALGVHALLIGESLMTAPDPAAKIRELFARAWA